MAQNMLSTTFYSHLVAAIENRDLVLDMNVCSILYMLERGILVRSAQSDYNTLLRELGYKMQFLGAGINACAVKISLLDNPELNYALKIVPYALNPGLGEINN